MSTELSVNWSYMPSYFSALQEIDNQGVWVANYFVHTVCDTSGIDYDACALRPLGAAFDQMGRWYREMDMAFTEKWNGLEDAVAATIKHIDEVDKGVKHDLARYTREMEIRDGKFVQYAEADISSFGLEDVQAALVAPEDGGDQLKGHDTDYMAISEGYDAARDGINDIIDFVNEYTPLEIERLPDDSLSEYLVYPLSGDYHRLQANAAACRITGHALDVWSSNTKKVALRSTHALDGMTGAALAGHLGLYALVLEGVRLACHGGAKVLDQVALMSERIAIRVEKAIIVLGKALFRLLKKLASRISSWLGWLETAKDIVTKGLDAFADVIRDVKLVIHIIQATRDLVDEVKAWAELQARRLHDFEELIDAVSKLPDVGALAALEGVESAEMQRVRVAIDDIKADFGPESTSTKEAARHALDSIDEVVDEAQGRRDDDQDENKGDRNDDSGAGRAGSPPAGTSSTRGSEGAR